MNYNIVNENDILIKIRKNGAKALNGTLGTGSRGYQIYLPSSTYLNYFNLSQPNLSDVPDLPILVNGFETMLR